MRSSSANGSFHRIEVAYKSGFVSPEESSLKKNIFNYCNIRIQQIKIVTVYTLHGNITRGELQHLGGQLFSDTVIQTFSVDKPTAKNFTWLIEIGFKPGVQDNVGHTAQRAITDSIGKSLTGVYTSKKYLLKGKIDRKQVERIVSELLANSLIERWAIVSTNEGRKKRTILPPPIVRLNQTPHVQSIDLEIPDAELITLSRDRLLALNLDEMKAIQSYYRNPDVGRKRKNVGLKPQPTDVELEAIAQTWSEHCKHKIFNARIQYVESNTTKIIHSLFSTYIKRATEKISQKRSWLVSVFTDNAGVIQFNDRWNLVMKVETHNSPSALDPFGGAVTGILGVNRDVAGTGIGAKLLFNTDVFCFASPFYRGQLPPRVMHPKRIFEGVRKGVEVGGNTVGVPTVNGSIVFDDRFLGKPLVFCGTGGIMPARIRKRKTHLKPVASGDLAVMCGGRIGKDGIHGATFSSEGFHEGSPVSAVQIGDPITQKTMLDALLEARDLGYYKTLTDNGAGGLSSSIGELAQIANGCTIFLDKCPLKYSHLNPWEILVSESQERMTVVVSPKTIDQFVSLLHSRGVEATVVGKFTSSGMFEAVYKKKTVASIDLDFIHHGVPRLELTARWKKVTRAEPQMQVHGDLQKDLRGLLSRLNVCSKESIVRQYDHEVQGTSVLKPMQGVNNDGPGDAAVIKPLPDSYEGVVVAHGICPKYGDIDTYHMTACAIDEAIRNAISVGGSLNHLAGLDNFCWCDPISSNTNPDGEYKLAQLVRANQALYDYTTAFGVPCISGKDSMKNDYQFGDIKISIPPTLLFSVIGKIEDIRKAVTMDVKQPGDLVYILGVTKAELGGSEYYAMKGYVGNNPPVVDVKKAIQLYNALSRAIAEGIVASCHDCSDGGLGVALAESAIAGGWGMDINLRSVPTIKVNRDDLLLFSESQSRFIVTVNPKHRKKFERIMKKNTFACAGKVRSDNRFSIKGIHGTVVLRDTIEQLKRSWQSVLR